MTDHQDSLQESKAAYLDLRDQLLKQAMKWNPTIYGIFATFCLAAVALYYLDARGYALGAVFLAGVAMLFVVNPNRPLASREYLQLPAALDGDGRPRCIFCGSTELEKTGPRIGAKTTTCVRCQSALYSK